MVDLAQVVEGNVGVSEEATVDDKRPRADNLPSRLGLGVEGEASLITRELAELPGALSARPEFKACGAYGGDRKEHEEPLEELDKVLVVGVLAPHLTRLGFGFGFWFGFGFGSRRGGGSCAAPPTRSHLRLQRVAR